MLTWSAPLSKRILWRRRGIRDSDLSAPQKIEKLLIEIMISFGRNYPFLYVYLQEDLSQVADGEPSWVTRAREISQRYEDALTEIIAEGARRGTLRDVASPRLASFALFGLISWSARWSTADVTRASGRDSAPSSPNLR